MTIPVNSLPSGGYGYNFPYVQVNPMNFLQITEYLKDLPQDDPLGRYFYEIQNLISGDPNIENCYIMDVDFLIFYKKLITIGDGQEMTLTIKCPKCGHKIHKKIAIDKDIHFKKLDEKIMNGAKIVLNGHNYETFVPTVKEFFKIYQRYLTYRNLADLDMIKLIALIKEADLYGNQVQNDVLGATHSDITLLMALKELYYDQVEDLIVHCPECEQNQELEERRGIAVSVNSLTVDFFRELYINSPIDESKIVFK